MRPTPAELNRTVLRRMLGQAGGGLSEQVQPLVKPVLQSRVVTPAETGTAVVGRCPTPRDPATSPGSGNVPLAPGDPESTVINDSFHNGFPGVCTFGECIVLGVYRKGTNHASTDGRIVARISLDLGISWGPENTVFDSADDLRDAEVTVLADGRIAVSYFSSNGTTPIEPLVSFSTDAGQTWATPVGVGHSFTDWAACSAKIIELADGTLLLPIYGRDTGDTVDSAAVVFSTDGGVTWGDMVLIADGPAAGRYFNEPNMVLLDNGDLVCFIRTDTVTYSLYRSASTDDGATWSAPAAVNNDVGPGRPSPVLLASGAIVLTYRQAGTSRAYWATSWDGGLTWSAGSLYSSANHEYGSLWEVVDGFAIMLSSLGSGSDANVFCAWLSDGY